jgi:6-pyruvoyltetrahydropterin/6-carboxytetrahydropterin synthase
MTYEIGTSVAVRALHRMPVDGPEGELHTHDYRIDVVVGRDELSPDGMVVDLDRLDSELGAIHDELAGRDLEMIRPPDAEAVTVEVFARWVHGRLAPMVQGAGGGELAVRVFESETAFGGYRAAVS